jgi:hypothetical protein
MKRCVWLAVAALLAWRAGGCSATAVDQNPCDVPGNQTYNCNFDTFSDHTQGGAIKQIPDGWWYFVLQGDPEFRPSVDTYWGAPSQEIWSEGQPFTAGLYQQVPAAPTKPDFERRLGLDPTGGSDPHAPSVVWGASSREVEAWPDLSVGAWATGPSMTVFVWVHHPVSHGVDQIFLDAVGLAPDPQAPTLTPTSVPPSPTATALPASPTPIPATPVPASTTPTLRPTQASPTTPTPTRAARHLLPPEAFAARALPTTAAIRVETTRPAPERTATASAPSPTPPATPTPLATPRSLADLSARAEQETAADVVLAAAQPAQATAEAGALFVILALSVLGGAGFLGAGLLWVVWRRR